MALAVITIQDVNDSIDVQFLFEPPVKDTGNTPAQLLAARMLDAVPTGVDA
jgi:hypothetical protein